jgi:soluble lytic murein transglycosylase-like protein
MIRETERRLVLLALVGTAAAGWMIAFHGAGVPSIQTAAAAAVTPATRVAPRATVCPLPRSLRPAFAAASRDSALPTAMLYAVAKVESNLRANAESEAGARGLLQVMPATGKSLALNIDEPTANVLAGARYLRQLIDRFGNSDVALAAYNAGPTAVEQAGGAPSIAVQRYVANVNLLWHSVAGCA